MLKLKHKFKCKQLNNELQYVDVFVVDKEKDLLIFKCK